MKIYFSVVKLLIAISVGIVFQQAAYAVDDQTYLKNCLGNDIHKYAWDIPGKALPRLKEEMTGKSIKLRDRNRLVIKGVRSVDFGAFHQESCRTLRVTYNVTLERTLRRDASGTATVHYGLKRGSERPGVTFEIHNPYLNLLGYDLSHLSYRGEMWWAERTPNSFFEPVVEHAASGHIVFLIPYKD